MPDCYLINITLPATKHEILLFFNSVYRSIAGDLNEWYLPSLEESKGVYAWENGKNIFPGAWYWTSIDLPGENGQDLNAYQKWFGCCESDIKKIFFKKSFRQIFLYKKR